MARLRGRSSPAITLHSLADPFLIRTRIPGGIDMAFDHDVHDGDGDSAAEDHDDPHQHNHHRDCGEHDDADDPPLRKRWVTERDEPAAIIARARNIAELELSIAVAPSGTDDVDSHVAAIGTRIGAGKRRAVGYCDVGVMLRRMPKVCEFCRSGALPHERLRTIAGAIVAVTDDNIEAVEQKFLDYLTPNKDFQALPGPFVFARELRRIVEKIEPISTPPDDDETKPIKGESYSVDNQYPSEYGELYAMLRKDRLAEFDATVRAIRDAKINAGQDCSLADALMAMCRGDFAGAKVSMNIYVDGDADENTLQVWLDGAGWLSNHVSKEWLARAHEVRLSSDSQTGGYVPTDGQKARVRGRDGGCRFPGCDVPAHKCQIDHVINYDPGGADDQGVTATWNLQCLCQHHHNLKTSKHWRAVMHDDGSVTWVDHTGAAFATTVPHGPIAHIKRQTFDQRATRVASTIHRDNEEKLRAAAEAAESLRQAEIDAALRTHARETRKYEEKLAEFIAGPINSTDPDTAAEARSLAEATDDGWPTVDDEL
ncbi:MAG TPA: HNH endonuclease, partial [Corynebacterium sp.]|uniref:HNH endonuclease signature motif containing protein n=1 Tax=Corynebacterium sp. TaxID=1720 RepID=UPI0017ADD7DB